MQVGTDQTSRSAGLRSRGQSIRTDALRLYPDLLIVTAITAAILTIRDYRVALGEWMAQSMLVGSTTTRSSTISSSVCNRNGYKTATTIMRMSRLRYPSIAAVFTLVFGIAGLSACDKRPINATAALSAPGTPAPAFVLQRYSGSDSLRSTDLQGAPAVLALWSTHCPYQTPWVASFDSLAWAYGPRGIRFVVLADDTPGKALDSVLARSPWRSAVADIGVASGRLAGLFDGSRAAPEKATDRVEFVLPSFLLLGPDGHVIRRAFGPAISDFRPALDSLLNAASVKPRR